MALFDVEVVLSPADVPPGLDGGEAVRKVELACGALVGLGKATVSYARSQDHALMGVTVRAGDNRIRLSEDAAERLAVIVRAAVRRALFPSPSVVK